MLVFTIEIGPALILFDLRYVMCVYESHDVRPVDVLQALDPHNCTSKNSGWAPLHLHREGSQ